MMTALHTLLDPKDAQAFVTERTAEAMLWDKLPAAAARQLVNRRIEDGDLLILAARGQTWTMRTEFATLAPWPTGHRISIDARLHSPAAVVVTDEHGETSELAIGALAMYELTAWRWTP
jgi:hypothetical protein